MTRSGSGLWPALAVLFFGLQALAAQAPPQGAGGGLLLFPTRLVFDQRRHAAEVTVTNPGARPCTYRVSLVGMAVDSEGTFQEVPLERRAGQTAVQDLVRFSPKIMTLNPQEAQSVRILVRKPAELPAGEYRAHLLFREEAPPPPGPGPAAGDGVSVQLKIHFGISIPLIIRQGEISASVALGSLTLEEGGKVLRCRLERSGQQSVFGHIQVTYCPTGGQPRLVAEAKGLAVYATNPSRNLRLDLVPEGKDPGLRAGVLRVTYSAPQEEGGAVLAEGTLALP
jgi:P pilus assembly chaperone PapD